MTDKNWVRYFLIAACLLLGIASSFAEQKEERITLVFVNSTCKALALKNPVNDARDIANSLRSY